uniref:Uncharacterized protein n=1 Tax=Plectus sambesii TaxID=2011161 RepID=A0A914XJ12_9BILA
MATTQPQRFRFRALNTDQSVSADCEPSQTPSPASSEERNFHFGRNSFLPRRTKIDLLSDADSEPPVRKTATIEPPVISTLYSTRMQELLKKDNQSFGLSTPSSASTPSSGTKNDRSLYGSSETSTPLPAQQQQQPFTSSTLTRNHARHETPKFEFESATLGRQRNAVAAAPAPAAGQERKILTMSPASIRRRFQLGEPKMTSVPSQIEPPHGVLLGERGNQKNSSPSLGLEAGDLRVSDDRSTPQLHALRTTAALSTTPLVKPTSSPHSSATPLSAINQSPSEIVKLASSPPQNPRRIVADLPTIKTSPFQVKDGPQPAVTSSLRQPAIKTWFSSSVDSFTSDPGGTASGAITVRPQEQRSEPVRDQLDVRTVSASHRHAFASPARSTVHSNNPILPLSSSRLNHAEQFNSTPATPAKDSNSNFTTSSSMVLSPPASSSSDLKLSSSCAVGNTSESESTFLSPANKTDSDQSRSSLVSSQQPRKWNPASSSSDSNPTSSSSFSSTSHSIQLQNITASPPKSSPTFASANRPDQSRPKLSFIEASTKKATSAHIDQRKLSPPLLSSSASSASLFYGESAPMIKHAQTPSIQSIDSGCFTSDYKTGAISCDSLDSELDTEEFNSDSDEPFKWPAPA